MKKKVSKEFIQEQIFVIEKVIDEIHKDDTLSDDDKLQTIELESKLDTLREQLSNFGKTKFCAKCLTTKPLTEFYKLSKGKGYISECKECFRIRQKKYYKTHSEQCIKNNTKYRKNNKERYQKLSKNYYYRDREKEIVLRKIRNFTKKLKDLDVEIEKFTSKGKTIVEIIDQYNKLKELYQKCNKMII